MAIQKTQPHRKAKQGRHNRTVTLLIAAMLLGSILLPRQANAQIKDWLLNTVAPAQTLVSLRENLDWRLMSAQAIKKDDCIRFVFQNPYWADAPETYKSFDMTAPYSQPCEFDTEQEAICSTIDQKTFEIKFTADSRSRKITGSSIGKPFQNPYSSREFDQVQTLYYVGCDLNSDPAVEGKTSIAAFQQSVIKASDVVFESSSEKLAVIDAILTMSFTPSSLLPQTGIISLQVPAWYTVSEQRLPITLSSDSMLAFESEAIFKSHAGEGFTVLSSNFDASSRSLTIQYSGTRLIPAGEQVSLTVTHFKNPVNKETKRGFRITTQDSQGYLVDQSEDDLALETYMAVVGNLVTKEVSPQGDAQGINIGRVFEYNKIQFVLGSYIPFEQFCYFKFVFPSILIIDEALTILQGDGIFKPSDTGYQLPTTSYTIDLQANTIYVEGCTQPSNLTPRPFGILELSYVLLPEYVTDTEPIEIYAYSDYAYSDLVFEESKNYGGGLIVTREMLQPGFMELLEFTPSNDYAFVEDVTYTVVIKPQHDMLPSTRVVLDMPENLTFDQQKGCKVTYTAADCQLIAAKNQLILSNLLSERTPGGTVLKFIISSANNPIGARDAGTWGARTEAIYYNEYYTVDGNDGGASFFAKAGYIKSQLKYDGRTTFSEGSVFDFTFETEHDVPRNGFITIQLPVEMAFPDELVQNQNPTATVGKTVLGGALQNSMEFVSITTTDLVLKFANGHTTEQNPIRMRFEQIRTPRSFRPTSEFTIQTSSVEGFVIDQGGSDITVVMTEMNTIPEIAITPSNLINGSVNDYHISLTSNVWLYDGDRLIVTTPESVGFGPNGISCDPIEAAPIGVSKLHCESIDEGSFAVTFEKVDDRIGKYEFTVHGMKNPPNFRRSSLFSDIFFQTSDYYSIQQVKNYQELWVETNEVAKIIDFTRTQSVELFGVDAIYTIQFTPVNPIGKDGIMTLSWTDQVEWNLDNDIVCKVETYQSFNQQCAIDFASKEIKILTIFKESDNYAAPITVTLEKLRNPLTNKGLKPFVIRTYDDQAQQYPIDKLEYPPLTQCEYPCKRCSQDKEYCYSCWLDDTYPFLMTGETTSICAEECASGWTTDGNQNSICSRCDVSCKTCQDKGLDGDRYECLECAPGYDLRLGQKCVTQCPIGTFQSGSRCIECDSTCLTCSGQADFCTSCSSTGTFNFLHDNKCLENSCPAGMGNLAGVCFDCEFPCSGCSTGPQICTSCSQEDGIAYLYGPTCITECPEGFQVNEVEKQCEGCGAGCLQCNSQDQRICEKCEKNMLMLEGTCVSACPKDYFADYDDMECVSLADLDISLIPFPCLIVAGTFFILSYVGHRQKRKHLMIPNWLVLMGLLEHGCLLSQIILNFQWGKVLYGVVVILAWMCFVAANIVFFVQHYRRITLKDRLYSNWRNRIQNRWARRLMNVAGLIGNWKAYKLSYSAFWGVKLTPARFSNAKAYRDLQKRFLWITVGAVYAPVMLINLIGLIDMSWGTQLYIQMVENVIIFALVTWASFWEQKKQETDYLADINYLTLKGGKMNVMSVLDEEDLPEFQKTKEHLLSQQEISKLFVERKFDELVELFGDRKAKSLYEFNRDKTADPRRVYTWPCSPSMMHDGPIEALPDPYPDNCYTQGLNEDQMAQMKFLSKKLPSKAIQSDAYDADHNLRKDAFLVGHKRDLTEVEKSFEKKKVRGRKNRYFKQIDNEDHEAGVLLDDDEEGQARNIQARNELLDARAELEATRLHEQSKLENEENRQKAMQLTEENLRLKKLLEEQRMSDARDQKEFQQRIMEEEKRRQAILANIEASRRQREARKNEVANNLESEKEARMREIERLEAEHMAKNASLSEKERQAAEAEFMAEKARLESEFNEKILKSKREAAPSESANSPGKFDKQGAFEANQRAIRLVPQAVAKPEAATAQEVSETVSVRKSATGSPVPGTQRMSMMNTADEASAFDQSYIQTTDQDHERRDFNEIDILGNLTRDEKGNIVVPTDEKTGSRRSSDLDGRPINHYGHLIDPETGDIIHRVTGTKVFARKDLDERGNIPMPFAIEKYNFSPFEMLGTFFYDDVEDPLSFQKTQRSGRIIDELGRFVSLQGFLVDKDGSVIDKHGVKRFDWSQFRQFGGLMPKLFNYYGKTFELQEVMGVFDRDSNGNIQLLLGRDDRGNEVYVDKAGFMVNQRGYIVTHEGHICTREGKVLFLKAQLKNNGEFPKIFPFTRFNINRIIGDIEMDPGGQPLLAMNAHGQTVDRSGRLVNTKGYLTDIRANVIDIRSKLTFEKALLDHNGDIPEIFRSNILRSDSQSSLSRFMSEIDRDQRFDESGVMKQHGVPRHAAASDTSFESMMDDSPSKYDKQNMRFSGSNTDVYGYGTGPAPKSARWAGNIPDNIMEEMSEYEAGHEPHQRKRKRGKGKGYIVEEITGRDVAMASAYGGVAKPRIRKTGPKFTTVNRFDRAGLQTSGSMRAPNPRMQNLTGKVGKFEVSEQQLPTTQQLKSKSSFKHTDGAGQTTRADITTTRTGGNNDASKMTGFRSGMNTGFHEQHPPDAQPSLLGESQMDEAEESTLLNMRNKRSAAQKKRAKKDSNKQPKVETSKLAQNALQMPKYDRAFEEEFEKVYKKDIDKFIDGSDFEVESLAGFSDISKGTFKSAVQNNPRMKGLEKVYLQRLEFQQLGQKSKKYRAKPQVKREFMDRFYDDPRYIAKGERLKFEIGHGGTQTQSSAKKQQPGGENYSQLQPHEQRSQTSLMNETGMVQTTGGLKPTQSPEKFKLHLQDSAHSGQRQQSRQNMR